MNSAGRFCAISLLMLIMVVGAHATQVAFEPSTLSFSDSNSKTVTIKITDIPAQHSGAYAGQNVAIGTFAFYLKFDTTKLAVENITWNVATANKDEKAETSPAGRSFFAGLSTAQAGPVASLEILSFTLRLLDGQTVNENDELLSFNTDAGYSNALLDENTFDALDIPAANWGNLTATVPPNPVQDLALTMVQRQRDPIKVGLTWSTGKVGSVQAQRLEGANWVDAPAGSLTWTPATKTIDVDTGVVGVETFEVRVRGLDQGLVWDGAAAVDAATNPDVGWVNAPTALTVDNEAPNVINALANTPGTQITVNFQAGEILDNATSVDPANYSVTAGVAPAEVGSPTVIPVTGVTRNSDTQVVLALGSAMPRDETVYAGANNVRDDLGNMMTALDAVAVSLPAFPPRGAFITVDQPRMKDPLTGTYGWTSGFEDDAQTEYSDDGGANWHPITATVDAIHRTWEWASGLTGTRNLSLRARWLEKGMVWDGAQNVDAAANPDAGWVSANVILDNEKPVPGSASGSGNLISVAFQANEDLSPGSVATLDNYEVRDMGVITANGATVVPVTEARIKAGSANIIELLLGAELAATQKYEVTVQNVEDSVGNAMAAPVSLELVTAPMPAQNVAVVLNAGARQKDDVVIDLTWTSGFVSSMQLQYDAGSGWTNAAGAVADNGAKKFTWTTGFAAPTALQVRARVIHRDMVWDGAQNVDAAANPNAGWSAPVALTVDNEPPTPISANGGGKSIELAFQAGEILHPEDLKTTGHYVVTDEGVATAAQGDIIAVTNAALKAGTTNVVMLTLASELSPAQKYKLAVQNIIDAVGNPIAQTTYLDVITEPKPGKNVAVVLTAGARQKDNVLLNLTWDDGFANVLELQYDTGGGWTNAAGTVGDTDAKTITWNSPFSGTQALQARARVVHRGKVWDGAQNVDAAANPNAGWSAAANLTVDNTLPDPLTAIGLRDARDITVTFNAGELLNKTVAEALASYTVTDEGVITTAATVLEIDSATLGAAGNVVTLTLKNALVAGKKYKVMVNAAQDVAGNLLAAAKALNFEVPANPELVSALFVGKNTVRAVFDKAMNIATLAAADWTLTAAGGATVAVTGIADTGNSKTFALTTATLGQKVAYTLTAPATAADSGGLLIQPTKRTATFTSRRWFDFAAGTRTIGIPLSDTGRVVELTGAQAAARYDPAIPGYIMDDVFGTGTGDVLQEPGKGYFAKFGAASTAYFDGDLLPSPVTVNTPAGWSLISPVRDITLGNTNPAIPYAWYYDGTGYILKANIPAGGFNVVDDKLEAWKGYFVKRAAAGDVQLGTAQVTAVPLNFGEGAKLVQLVASAGESVDAMNVCGIGGSAVSLANPPLVEGAVDLAFGDGLAVDVRTGDFCQKWDLVVSTSLADTPVTVSAPDLSALPGQYAVILTDKESGKSCYLRTSAGFTFQSGADGASRKMSLEIVPRNAATLVSSMSVNGGAGNSAVVTYSLNGAASVTAEVLNIAGRKVRQIVADRVETAGTHSLVWNLSSDAGTAVPRGLYMIVIQARSEDGQQVRAVRPLSVNR